MTSGISRNENNQNNGMERSELEQNLSSLLAKPFTKAILHMKIFCYAKYTCSRAGMLDFEQVCLS